MACERCGEKATISVFVKKRYVDLCDACYEKLKSNNE